MAPVQREACIPPTSCGQGVRASAGLKAEPFVSGSLEMSRGRASMSLLWPWLVKLYLLALMTGKMREALFSRKKNGLQGRVGCPLQKGVSLLDRLCR